MRTLVVVLVAVVALGAPAQALVNTESHGTMGGRPVDASSGSSGTTPTTIVYWVGTVLNGLGVPAALSWIGGVVNSLAEQPPSSPSVPSAPLPTPAPAPVPPPLASVCAYPASLVADPAVYVRCSTQATQVSDPRTGVSYTATASADVCREEASGDECVGTTQSVARTGAEADPAVQQTNDTVALPQACVGSTCSPSVALVAPNRVTVFESGTTPEGSAYTPTGVVNANAPQVCVSVDNTCSAGSGTGTTKAAVEAVDATQVVTTQ